MNNKDLISQYVDTGLTIPEYQYNQLPNWAKKTYFRKRLIASKNGNISDGSPHKLVDYELAMLDEHALAIYLNNRMERSFHIKDYEFNRLNTELRIKLATTRAKKGNQINDSMFDILPDEIKKGFIKTRLEAGNPLSNKILQYGGDKVKDMYLDSQVKRHMKRSIGTASLQQGHGKNRDEYPSWFEVLPTDLRIKSLDKIFDYIIKYNIEGGFRYINFPDTYYPHLGPNKKAWLQVQFEEGYVWGEWAFDDLTDEQKRVYVRRQYDKSGWLPNYMEPYLNK